MKFYSEKLERLFDSEEQLIDAEHTEEEKQRQAELEAQKKNAQRAERAKEVENARAVAVEALENYKQLLDAFIADYHTYHFSISEKDTLPTALFKFLRF